MTRDGLYTFSTGMNQDTLVEIFDCKALTNMQNLDTNGIRNVEIKMTPDDRYVAISTFMYEIAVFELKRTVRFNKAIEGDEVSLKVERIKSVSGIKTPIDSFDFSNDNRYFIVSCENTKIKILQNYGNFEESKVISEFTCKEAAPSFWNDRVTMFVSSVFNGKMTGFIAVSKESDIYVYDLEGNLYRVFTDAHDSKICLLKLVRKSDEDEKECVLLSGAKDGRFCVWSLN